MDDVAARRFNARRRRHHIHHHEGWNIAASGGRQKASGAVSQGRIKHRNLLFRGVPQTSRIRRFGRAYIVSDPPPTVKDRSMLLRLVTGRKLPKLTAVATAIALTLTPLSAYAEEQQKGPP